MKCTVAALLLAMACASAYAQDRLAASFAHHGSMDAAPDITTTISPLFIEPSPEVHIETPHPGRGLMITGLAMTAGGAALLIKGVNEIKLGKEIDDEYVRTHPRDSKHEGGAGGLTKQFWGAVMVLGGSSTAFSGIYIGIRGGVKRHDYRQAAGIIPASDDVKGWGRGRRTFGPMMAGAGTALGIAGVFVFAKGKEEARAWHRNHPGEKTFGLWDNDKEGAGAVMIGAGAGLIVSGLAMWMSGVRDGREYEERYGTSRLQLRLGTTTTVTYRF